MDVEAPKKKQKKKKKKWRRVEHCKILITENAVIYLRIDVHLSLATSSNTQTFKQDARFNNSENTESKKVYAIVGILVHRVYIKVMSLRRSDGMHYINVTLILFLWNNGQLRNKRKYLIKYKYSLINVD